MRRPASLPISFGRHITLASHYIQITAFRIAVLLVRAIGKESLLTAEATPQCGPRMLKDKE